MQKIAPVARIGLGLQLVGHAQAQRTQSKKSVGAVAQVLVGAGRQGLGQQALCCGRGGWRHAQVAHPGHPWVHARQQARLALRGQDPRTGQTHVAPVLGAPQHIHVRLPKHHPPRGQGRLRQVGAGGQTQGLSLPWCPLTRHVRAGVEVQLVTARRHHGGERTPEQLGHGQNHHRGVGLARRRESGGLQHIAHPSGEGRERECLVSALGPHDGRRGLGKFQQFLARSRCQTQSTQQRLTRAVMGKHRPQATGLQRAGQVLQPLVQGARCLQTL